MELPKQYTNRELGIMLENLCNSSNLAHKELKDDLQEIKNQTKMTNGRVNKLENWRNFIVGAIAVITFLIPITVALAIKFK